MPDEKIEVEELDLEDSSSETSGEEKEEPQVPISRLREEIEKRRELEKQLQNKSSNQEYPDEEKKVREVMARVEAERVEREKQEEKRIQEELDTLHKIHGNFNDKKLLKLVNEYGVYGDGGAVKWEKAMDLYNKLNIDPTYKPPVKMPSSKISGEKSLEVETPVNDFSKRSMGDLVMEGLKKFGIK